MKKRYPLVFCLLIILILLTPLHVLAAVTGCGLGVWSGPGVSPGTVHVNADDESEFLASVSSSGLVAVFKGGCKTKHFSSWGNASDYEVSMGGGGGGGGGDVSVNTKHSLSLRGEFYAKENLAN